MEGQREGGEGQAGATAVTALAVKLPLADLRKPGSHDATLVRIPLVAAQQHNNVAIIHASRDCSESGGMPV